jgi:hypothetical protein
LASDFELERSPEARALAEEALFRLLVALGDQEVPIVVLGGLVPEVLAQGLEVPDHLGTTDVDLHVSLLADADQDLGALEVALEHASFVPEDHGWRWRTEVGGLRVKMEFLCDREDVPEHAVIPLPGCHTLSAVNLRGTGFVARDWVSEELEGVLDGRAVRVKARFAGLRGYVLSKAYAVRFRAAEKDHYDFVYVLLFNKAGGPGPVGTMLRNGEFRDDIHANRSIFLEVAARFAGVNDYGPTSYAAQALLVNPEEDSSRLRQDAVQAVADFIEALEMT